MNLKRHEPRVHGVFSKVWRGTGGSEFIGVSVERVKVNDWLWGMHDEVVKVPVESFKVHDWNRKVPDKKFVSASLLGGASRNKPCQQGWLSYRSSTPKAQLSWRVCC